MPGSPALAVAPFDPSFVIVSPMPGIGDDISAPFVSGARRRLEVLASS
jgi:hypothetical protein